MGIECGCENHDQEEDSGSSGSSRKKVEDLMLALRELGFRVEETPDGEIRVSED